MKRERKVREREKNIIFFMSRQWQANLLIPVGTRHASTTSDRQWPCATSASFPYGRPLRVSGSARLDVLNDLRRGINTVAVDDRERERERERDVPTFPTKKIRNKNPGCFCRRRRRLSTRVVVAAAVGGTVVIIFYCSFKTKDFGGRF